jgi:hypothetical protein
MSAASAISEGKQKKDYANFQANQANADAIAEKEHGIVEAGKIRKQGKYTSAEAASALAGGGVEINAGTALKIDQQIARNTEEDALQQILFGTRKGGRLDQEATGLRAAGKNAQRAGYMKATGSLLSAGASLASPGWKRVAAEQAPAPVEDRVISIGS